MLESGEGNGKWFEVYPYYDLLTHGVHTTALAGKLTMKDMGMDEYADINDINVSMNGYACTTAGVELIEDAWGYVKREAGM